MSALWGKIIIVIYMGYKNSMAKLQNLRNFRKFDEGFSHISAKTRK